MTDSTVPKITTLLSHLNHPSVFQKNIEKPKDRIPPGTVVDLYSKNKTFLGRGFYNGHSRIGFRLLTTHETQVIDADFFYERISSAYRLRVQSGILEESNAYRLCHSEGDFLPGLILDVYANYVVIEWFSAGMFRHRKLIVEALNKLLPNPTIYWYAQEHIQKQESFDCWDMEPPKEPVRIHEHSVEHEVQIGSKRKTGFFLDQRLQRKLIAPYTHGQDVLDMFCHTGAFSRTFKTLGKPLSLTAVDLDEDSITYLTRAIPEVKGFAMDALTYMKEALLEKKTFGLIVLDPPKLCKSKDDLEKALQNYLILNTHALKLVKHEGYLLTCSCTGLVSEEMFISMLHKASERAHVKVQVLYNLSQGPDHPYSASHQESKYLKTLFVRVLHGI